MTSHNLATTVNVSVSYSSMDACSRSGPGVQRVPDPDISTATEVLLDDSFVGGTSSFCVFYTLHECEVTSDTNMSCKLQHSVNPCLSSDKLLN